MKYYSGIEKQSQTIIKKIGTHFLYFSPSENGKYEFCSDDPKLQDWCDHAKHKKIKKDAIYFVAQGCAEAFGLSLGKKKKNTYFFESFN